MKKLMILMLLSIPAMAAEEIPAYMKDGTITVTLKSGKTYTYSLNEYKVVKRGSGLPAGHEAIVELHKKVVELSENQQKKNRVRLMGGYGPSGKLESSVGASSATVKTETGVIGGVGYDRMLNKDISVGGQVQTNKTILLNVGKDF